MWIFVVSIIGVWEINSFMYWILRNSDVFMLWKLIWWFWEEGEFQEGFCAALDTSLHCVLLLSVSDLSCVAVSNMSHEIMLLLVVALHHQISCLTHVSSSALERTEFPEMNTHCNMTSLKACGTVWKRPTWVITFNLCWILLKLRAITV